MQLLLTKWRALSVRTKVEIIVQTGMYLFISPRAYTFFYGGSTNGVWDLKTIAIGVLLTLIFALSYVFAVWAMKDTRARERWALFFLSFVLVPAPLALAHVFAQKMKHVWASMLGAVAVYFVAQIAFSQLFGLYIGLIDRLVN